MPSRRFFFLGLAALAVLAGPAHAAPPTVEILAMPHPPVRMALQPLRQWLAAQGAAIVVKEIDSETAQGAQRMAQAGLSGHIPILILIDGEYRFQRRDGSAVALVNFPDLPASPPGVRGNWLDADVEAVLKERLTR